MRDRFVGATLLLSGIVHLAPAIGVAGGARLVALYGITLTDPSIELLLRHRALMFGLLGATMIAACFVRSMRAWTLPLALVSTLGFVVLAAPTPIGAELTRVMWIDVVLSVLLLAATATASLAARAAPRAGRQGSF